MGHRTIVIFDNDHLDLIEKDPKFAEKLHSAILKQNCHGKPVEVIGNGKGMIATVADVVHSSHSSRNFSLRVIGFNAHEIEE